MILFLGHFIHHHNQTEQLHGLDVMIQIIYPDGDQTSTLKHLKFSILTILISMPICQLPLNTEYSWG